MGLLLFGVVAGFLIGYGLAPSQASFQECALQGCLDRAAASQPMEQNSTQLGLPAIAGAKRAAAAKSKKPSSAGSDGRGDLVKTAHVPTRIRCSRARVIATYNTRNSSASICRLSRSWHNTHGSDGYLMRFSSSTAWSPTYASRSTSSMP